MIKALAIAGSAVAIVTLANLPETSTTTGTESALVTIAASIPSGVDARTYCTADGLCPDGMVIGH